MSFKIKLITFIVSSAVLFLGYKYVSYSSPVTSKKPVEINAREARSLEKERVQKLFRQNYDRYPQPIDMFQYPEIKKTRIQLVGKNPVYRSHVQRK